MKFCSQCGAALNDDANVCSNCGQPQIQMQAPTSTYGQPQYQEQAPTYDQPLYQDQASTSTYEQPQYQEQTPTSTYDQPQYQQQAPNMVYAQPLSQLKTNRSMIKLLLLTFITLGIYAIVWYSSVSTDINLIASRYDGKKTMHFCLLSFVVAPFTFGIGAIVWYHKLCARIGDELQRRGISYGFGAKDFWLWNVLGSLIVVGPFIFLHNLCKAMNLLCEDFNLRG